MFSLKTPIDHIQKKYRGQIDSFDLTVLISFVIGKNREFVLTHPEFGLSFFQNLKLTKLIKRRMQNEPVAYLTGHKEFFGLDFLVSKDTLIPRPETELIVEDVLSFVKALGNKKIVILDIGTGSGNIIISLASQVVERGARNVERKTWSAKRGAWGVEHEARISFVGADISKGALRVAKRNSKNHGLSKKITFFHSDLLSNKNLVRHLQKQSPEQLIITANLPYLSQEIFNASPKDVREYEPKSALFSPEKGLWHYKKLLTQIMERGAHNVERGAWSVERGAQITLYLEISPEQKDALEKIAKYILPHAEISFLKDLAGKWRVCKVVL